MIHATDTFEPLAAFFLFSLAGDFDATSKLIPQFTMKQYQLTNLGACCRCHKKLAQTASPMFFTLKVERWMLDIMAVQRQIGLEMQIGPLAGVMGPDEDLAEKIGESKTMMICIECSFRDVVIAALAEGSGWGERSNAATRWGQVTPAEAANLQIRKT